MRCELYYETRLLKKGVSIVRGHDINILRTMIIADYMDIEYESLKESIRLKDIILNTRESRYPHFLVINDKDELVGMLSMRDIKNCLPETEDLNEFIVAADIMTKNVYCITKDDNLATAFEIFEGKQISTLPVVDVNNSETVVGVLKKMI